MLIGYFTERPYQDPNSGYFGAAGREIQDLSISNGEYDAMLGADLYHRYLDEKLYVEEVGFDAIMLNEHHSTPFCMGGVMNLEAAILAKTTQRVKIVLNGNVLPIWDDPLWLAESLATIDMISRGRLVTGWVRGTGRESVAHNSQPPFNWERFQEAHDFVIKAWTTPGPFRWEGEHYDYRYVNPWMRPYQQPHPLIMIPGVLSRNTVAWAAKHRYPYVMLATRIEPTKLSFDYYREVAREEGYEPGPEHIGYLFKVHVDETEELAYETGKKYLEGPGNIFLEGSRGTVSPVLQNLPGLTDRNNLLPTGTVGVAATSRGHVDLAQQAAARDAKPASNGNGAKPAQPPAAILQAGYDEQLANMTIITGTPKTVLPKIRHVLEELRPGSIFFWDGDGAMTHDDAMRSLRLMGSDILPAVRDMARELDLPGPFERNPMLAPPVGSNGDGREWVEMARPPTMATPAARTVAPVAKAARAAKAATPVTKNGALRRPSSTARMAAPVSQKAVVGKVVAPKRGASAAKKAATPTRAASAARKTVAKKSVATKRAAPVTRKAGAKKTVATKRAAPAARKAVAKRATSAVKRTAPARKVVAKKAVAVKKAAPVKTAARLVKKATRAVTKAPAVKRATPAVKKAAPAAKKSGVVKTATRAVKTVSRAVKKAAPIARTRAATKKPARAAKAR